LKGGGIAFILGGIEEVGESRTKLSLLTWWVVRGKQTFRGGPVRAGGEGWWNGYFTVAWRSLMGGGERKRRPNSKGAKSTVLRHHFLKGGGTGGWRLKWIREDGQARSSPASVMGILGET